MYGLSGPKSAGPPQVFDSKSSGKLGFVKIRQEKIQRQGRFYKDPPGKNPAESDICKVLLVTGRNKRPCQKFDGPL